MQSLQYCDGVVVGESASSPENLGSIPVSSHTEDYEKTVVTASLLGAQRQRDNVEIKPASLLFASLVKTVKSITPSLFGRQVVGLGV